MPHTKTLSAAEIMAAIRSTQAERDVAASAVEHATNTVRYERGLAAAGAANDLIAAEKVLATSKARLDALDAKLEDLKVLVPQAELQAMLADREASIARNKAENDELREKLARREALRPEIEALEKRIADLTFLTSNFSLRRITERIATHWEKYRAELQAAGLVEPGAARKPVLADIQTEATFVCVGPTTLPVQRDSNLNDILKHQEPPRRRGKVWSEESVAS